jgi:hypothetical protein
MWRSNEYCCYHHQSSSSGNGSQTMVGGRSGDGVTYSRNIGRCNRWHSHRLCISLQMQRCACVCCCWWRGTLSHGVNKMTTCRGARVHPNRQVWASRNRMWRSNEYCWHHHRKQLEWQRLANNSRLGIGGWNWWGGGTNRRIHQQSNRLQMQRCACVSLLVAGHIITWCEQNGLMNKLQTA